MKILFKVFIFICGIALLWLTLCEYLEKRNLSEKTQIVKEAVIFELKTNYDQLLYFQNTYWNEYHESLVDESGWLKKNLTKEEFKFAVQFNNLPDSDFIFQNTNWELAKEMGIAKSLSFEELSTIHKYYKTQANTNTYYSELKKQSNYLLKNHSNEFIFEKAYQEQGSFRDLVFNVNLLLDHQFTLIENSLLVFGDSIDVKKRREKEALFEFKIKQDAITKDRQEE